MAGGEETESLFVQVIEADIGSMQRSEAVDRARHLLQLNAAEGAAVKQRRGSLSNNQYKSHFTGVSFLLSFSTKNAIINYVLSGLRDPTWRSDFN